MKNKTENTKEDFIYKFIKYSDNEVINKIMKIEEINSKSISKRINRAYMNLFI